MMEIQYLAIRDIGPFRGFHAFDFKSKEGKVGFAIFSKNGRGKTSLFNAMKWCLFGEVFERSRITDGGRMRGRRRPIVGDFGDPLMNQDAYDNERDPEMSVTIIADSEEGGIQVSRSAKSRVGGLPRHDEALKVDLVVEYGGKTETGKEGQELIERFFPNEISRFFFIDGESLEEYVNLVKSGQVGGIKEDVESVLKIPALTRGFADLQQVKKEALQSKKAGDKRRKSAARKGRDARKKGVELDGLREKLDQKRGIRERSRDKLAGIEEELRGYDEATAHIEKLVNLRSKRDGLLTAVERSAETRHKQSKNAWKILIWEKAEGLHGEADEMMRSAQNSKYQIDSKTNQVQALSEELSEWTGVCTHCNQPLQDATAHKDLLEKEIREKEAEIEDLRSGPSMSTQEIAIALGDLSKLNPPHGSREILLECDESWRQDRSVLESVIEELEREEERGLKGVDQEKVQSLYEEKGKLGISIRTLGNSIDELSSKVKLAEIEVGRLLGERGADPDYKEARIIESMDRLLVTIEDTIAEYREVAREEVEKRASEAFIKVINAPDALTGIILDKNFSASIRGRGGKAIGAPSSGQEITMTLCVLDALRQTSGVDAPIFFDTPGRSLDDDHKRAQLEYFWKVRGHQFVIFPHSGEYKIEETVAEFGGHIGRAWELLWPVDYVNCPECGASDPLKDGGEKKCMSCEHVWDITSRNTIVREIEV